MEPEALQTDVEAFLDQELPVAPTLKLGQLDNGLRYVILPNKLPPNRFEAHLEMHVGGHRHLPCRQHRLLLIAATGPEPLPR